MPRRLRSWRQTRHGLVGLRGHADVVFFDVAVGVPLEIAGAAAGDHRDEAHAFFDQPAGQQAAAGVVVGRLDAYAVEVESFLGFVRDVERRRRLGLHLER